jgi:predicted dehydrogenase
LRAIVVGAGPMGRGWLQVLKASDDVDTVGLVDLNLDVARHAAAASGHKGLPVATTITELLKSVDADVLINVTIPLAHHAVSTEALLAGLPVLTEKPITPTVAEGLSLAAVAEHTGELLMVSQSRRYYRSITQFRNAVRQLGDVGTVTAQFFRAPHFGGFRDAMAHPLLIDMAIHHFDAFRYIIDDEPVSVSCDEFNPGWSWYDGDANVIATFTTEGGTRFAYAGSWCSPGLNTSWNAEWRVSAEHGTAVWDGENLPTWEAEIPVDAVEAGVVPEEFAGALAEFVRSLRTGILPAGHAVSNIRSLAMVEAAIEAAATDTRVFIPDVIERALTRAIEVERDPRSAKVLERWRTDGLE